MGKKVSGVESFDSYYTRIYGERWPRLREALFKPTNPVAFETGLRQPYFLDEASLYPAKAMEINPGDIVLDMCAAPGGKTLVMAAALNGTGTLFANDLSGDRRRRLASVIEDHLPAELRENIRITGTDGVNFGIKYKNFFDRVLLDAPCSSERHVLNSPEHLRQWSPGRSRNLTYRQFALLASAFDSIKPGGIVVYSTCSLNPAENDGVIEKLHKKRENLFEIIKKKSPRGEETLFGWAVYPDRCGGIGPIYYSVIRCIR